MIIECTIKRPRTVTLGKEVYEFEKDSQGRFVAEVTDEDHIDRLLDIHCYRKAASTAKSVKPESKQPVTATVGTSLPVNPLAGQGTGSTIEPKDDGGEGGGEGGEGEEGGAKLDRPALAAEYEKKFGKKPHHSQSAERIKQLLEEEAD